MPRSKSPTRRRRRRLNSGAGGNNDPNPIPIVSQYYGLSTDNKYKGSDTALKDLADTELLKKLKKASTPTNHFEEGHPQAPPKTPKDPQGPPKDSPRTPKDLQGPPKDPQGPPKVSHAFLVWVKM